MELKYLSHPNRLLSEHISIMGEFFDDELFKEAVKYHDVGKCTKSFQQYIKGESNSSKPHAFVSGVIFLLSQKDDFDIKRLFFIYNAIISHHMPIYNRNLITEKLYNLDKTTIELYDELKEYNDIKEFWQLKKFNIDSLEDIAFIWEDIEFNIDDFITQKLLFSKLIFADKYEAISKDIYTQTKLTHNIEDIKIYKDKRGFKESDFRANMSREILSNYQINKNELIYTITAPTGSGKTLASLELALTIAKNQNRDKIIYTMPFTSIIDQSVEIFRDIFKDKKITPQHYLTTLNSKDEEIANDYDRLNYLLHSWGDNFILSTFYQLFFATLGNKNMQSVKLCNMQNSVIVLDEVQASPFALWKLLQSFLPKVATHLNSTFILMSATMPIITSSAMELAPKEELFIRKNRYTLKSLNLESEDKLFELSQKIMEAFSNYGSVLCVANTIKNSKLLYKILKQQVDSNNLFLLNSYMLPKDRKRVINSLRDKNSNQVNGKILISTQVVEAGVDLDFRVGFREFAPLSSIIQSAGRVNREARFDNSTIFVFESISKGVYDSVLLNITHKILGDEFEICEKDILDVTQEYFKSVDIQISDSKALFKKIKDFDFKKIDEVLQELFSDDKSFQKSVVIGVNLKELESKYFEARNNIDDKWELKRFKEELFNSFIQNLLNIKIKDLASSGITYEHSDIFGLYYIPVSEGIYSSSSGFLIEEER